MDIDVYKRYYEAACTFNGVKRKAAVVTLTSRSGGGEITYAVTVSFFPHRTKDDFGVSYDAYSEKILFSGKGRRSKKKEAVYLDSLTEAADEAANAVGGRIFWDKPLGEEQRA
ncbi:MAG: hypothetical protein IKI42_03250 [Clostridia bacterium]|nr:hypothetical protein [Clostridia bacterium]